MWPYKTALITFILTLSAIDSAVAQNSDFKMQWQARLRNFSITGSAQSPIHPNDKFDGDINSPKSAMFSRDGRKLYVNSLEGARTVVYNYPSLEKSVVIHHRFSDSNSHLVEPISQQSLHLFSKSQKTSKIDNFSGKPVEMALSPDGRYLWIPYYRKSTDASGTGPSVVAIVDTSNDTIVRAFETGPIPKFVSLSPDGKLAAITHWGDNTITIIDTNSMHPNGYRRRETLVVENVLEQEQLTNTNRDRTCGFCLRGTVFTPDSRYLIVARMGGGGLAAFDLQYNRYLGSLMNVASTPRHLIISPDNTRLLVSSNVSGVVSSIDLNEIIAAFHASQGKRNFQHLNWLSRDLGSGARTIDTSADGAYIFVALNEDKKITMIDANTLKPLAVVATDPYPVGLATSPIDNVIVVTAQGKSGSGGGNAVNFYSYAKMQQEIILTNRSTTNQ